MKLVDGPGESASALAREQMGVSSLEVILDSTSSEVLTTCCEEFVEAAAELAFVQALQDPDVASSKEESITAGPQTAPHDTLNGSSSAFPSSRDKFLVGGTESKPTVSQQDDLDEFFIKLTDKCHGRSEVSITSSPRSLPHYYSSSLQSRPAILMRNPPNCFQTFYIRMDRRGFFCYPDVGGPFHSVHEADDAIKCFLDELRHRGRYIFFLL